MKLIEILQNPFSRSKEQTHEGRCELSWGYEQYDGKIRILFKDKQIDVNNNRRKYMFIREFVVTHIDGIKLKKALIKICKKCKIARQ